MALSQLNSWRQASAAAIPGTACGAPDKPAEQPKPACGTACGAPDKPAEQPKAACGTACGASDK